LSHCCLSPIMFIHEAMLAKSLDCLGLAAVPAHYREALSNAGSAWLKPLAALLNPNRDPLDVLRKLDSLLTCIGKRMVIFLEDLDRDRDGATDWKELASLLDRLKELDRVSFVLAVNRTGSTRDVLMRVCEHLELIPPLSRGEDRSPGGRSSVGHPCRERKGWRWGRYLPDLCGRAAEDALRCKVCGGRNASGHQGRHLRFRRIRRRPHRLCPPGGRKPIEKIAKTKNSEDK
jgi:hypothetical protein